MTPHFGTVSSNACLYRLVDICIQLRHGIRILRVFFWCSLYRQLISCAQLLELWYGVSQALVAQRRIFDWVTQASVIRILTNWSLCTLSTPRWRQSHETRHQWTVSVSLVVPPFLTALTSLLLWFSVFNLSLEQGVVYMNQCALWKSLRRAQIGQKAQLYRKRTSHINKYLHYVY